MKSLSYNNVACAESVYAGSEFNSAFSLFDRVKLGPGQNMGRGGKTDPRFLPVFYS